VKKIGVPLKVLLATAIIFFVAVQGVHAMPTQGKQIVCQEHYKKTETRYTSMSTPLGAQVLYTVIQAERSGAAENTSIQANVTVYASTSISGSRSVELNVSSSYDSQNMQLKVVVLGSNATLVSLEVYQAGVDQIVWSGVEQLNGSLSFTGQAYIARDVEADLELGFASSGGVKYVDVPLNQSLNVTLHLPSVSFIVKSEARVSSTLVVSVPQGYQAYTENSSWVNATAQLNLQVANTSIGLFLGESYPSIAWTGVGVTQFNGGYDGGFGVNVSSRAYAFYGVNGTLVGFVKTTSLQGSHSLQLPQLNVTTQVDASSILVVAAQNQPTLTLQGKTQSYELTVGGRPVLVMVNSSLTVESTASIQMTHEVYVNTTALLVYLNTTKASAYALINPDTNTSTDVVQANPQSAQSTTLTVNSETYQATELRVSVTGYTVFNVSVNYPSVVVFKSTQGGYVELNHFNYWSENGRVFVFDDPANTYYVANAASGTPATQQTSTSQQSQASTSTSTPTPMFGLALIVGVMVIVIVVVAVLMSLRRR